MVIGPNDDEEITGEGYRQSSHDGEPLVDLHRTQQGKESKTIEQHDGYHVAMSPKQDILDRLQPKVLQVFSTTNLIVWHAREHRACPPGAVSGLLVILDCLVHSGTSLHAIAGGNNLAIEHRRHIDASHHCKDDYGQ